ncbi:MAG: RNA polymerase sigma-54 factor, partial [Pannonibacter indicus]
YVEAELERNPLLERTESGDGTGAADGQGGDHDGASDASGGDDFEAGGGEFSSSDGAPSEWLKSDLEPQAESIASQMDTDLG